MSPSRAGWEFDRDAEVPVVRCNTLAEIPGVAHAFSTRLGPAGETEFDLGGADDPSSVHLDRRTSLLRAAGLQERRPTPLRQVHGGVVVDVMTLRGGAVGVEADGAFALRASGRDWAPSVRWADCVPLLLAARDGSAIAALHAGWRGVVARVAEQGVERLVGCGVPVRELIAALGPAIGPCCFEVGADVAERVATAAGVGVTALAEKRGGPLRLDLRRAVQRQLVRAGLDDRAILVAPWCTACSPEQFFSYRRDGASAGRQMAFIGWRG